MSPWIHGADPVDHLHINHLLQRFKVIEHVLNFMRFLCYCLLKLFGVYDNTSNITKACLG